MNTPIVHLDAGTFQTQLIQLTEAVAQKVKREAPGLLPGVPAFVSFDLHILIRQAMRTYDLFFYLNADERREKDCYWRPAYSVVILPLIRNMIDCLYNITAILQNPGANGPWYKMSGFKKLLAALKEDEARYGGRPAFRIQNEHSKLINILATLHGISFSMQLPSVPPVDPQQQVGYLEGRLLHPELIQISEDFEKPSP